MGRKRVTAAKKRVLRSATTKNIEFLVEKLPELKELKSKHVPVKRKPKLASGAIDMQSSTSGSDLVIHLDQNMNGNDFDDDSDVPLMSLSSHPRPPRTYRRKMSLDRLMNDWEDDEDENGNTAHAKDPDQDQATNQEEDQAEIEMDLEDQRAKAFDKASGCTCGMAEEATKYKNLYESLRTEMEQMTVNRSEASDLTKDPSGKKHKKLVEENAELTVRNVKLQEALTSKLLPKPKEPFKKVKGVFLDAETLRRLSVEARTDYLFVKFLMMRLWPEGFAGRSVTGRPSNNPSGRSKSGQSTNDDPSSIDQQQSPPGRSVAESTPKLALEPDKVEFIASALYHRRLFLQDDEYTAKILADDANMWMTRVITNSLRKSSRK